MTLLELSAKWPERGPVEIRLHLYDHTRHYRCDFAKLQTVFDLAQKHGVNTQISTNLNRLNAVYVTLDNYVLGHHRSTHAKPGSWGDEYGFVLALARTFPGEVFVDDPVTELRHHVKGDGSVSEGWVCDWPEG